MMAFFADILASTAGELPSEWPSAGEVLLYLAGIVFFLLLNAFFVASEFAIVKVRPSQLEFDEQEAKRSSGRAKRTATGIVENLDRYLSANQLGITLASLALGFLGGPLVERLIGPFLRGLSWFPHGSIGVVSWILALVSFTFLHVVIGELVPKSVAIRRPLPTTLALARPLHLFYRAFSSAIALLNRSANFLLKHLLKIDPASEVVPVHSSEELALLVSESLDQEEVTETERTILINALELNNLEVREIMTPRSEVISLDVKDDFATNLARVKESSHTRFPLIDGHLDQTLGMIHIKDVFRLEEKEEPDLEAIKRGILRVPESMPLDRLLQLFLKERVHLALAMDEFGGAVGLVFMDNVLEELVGDIRDEFDVDQQEFLEVKEGEYLVSGGLGLYEISEHLTTLQLESDEVTTIGGYVTHLLGHLPKTNDRVQIDDFDVKVEKADGRRVVQLRFREAPETL
ncbi:MAG: hemolysin family protein [Verrucomicrobiota bacterium]